MGSGASKKRSRVAPAPDTQSKKSSTLRRIQTAPVSKRPEPVHFPASADLAIKRSESESSVSLPNDSSSGSLDTFENPLAGKISKHLSDSARSKWKPLLAALKGELPEWGTLLKGAKLSVKKIGKSSKPESEKVKLVINFLNAVIKVLDGPIMDALKRLQAQTSENADEYDEPDMIEFGKRLNAALNAAPKKLVLEDRITLLDTISTVQSAVMSTNGLDVRPTSYHSKAINSVIRNLGSALLDKSRTAQARLKDFSRFNDRFVGEFGLLDSPFLLDYISKGIFIFLWAQKLKPLPVDLVINRESAFAGMITSLTQRKPPLLKVNDSEPKILTFRPYFRSEYGAKEVGGEKVEEGEGYGPRKEFFGLASRQLKERYGPPKKGSGLANFSEGDSKVKIKISSGDTAGSSAMPPRTALLCFEPQDGRDMGIDAQAVVVDAKQRGDTTGTVRTEHIFTTTATKVPYVYRKRQAQLFTYHQPTESYWFNSNLDECDEFILKYTAIGRLLATAITDRCTIDLPLALPVFQHLMHGPSFRPTLSDLENFDPDSHSMALRIASMTDKEFAQILAAEGTESMTQKHYVDQMVHSLLVEDVAWQSKALRQGFNLGTKSKWWKKLEFSPSDLQLLVCGSNLKGGKIPDFRTLFRVHEDPELVQHEHLRECLWSVIDKMSNDQMRQFLKFVTGVSRLPIPGTETVKIEMPFMVYGHEEHKKNLERLPQAHTCDNILELPNYWESLIEVHGDEGETDVAAMKTKLEAHMQAKFLCAIQNAEGFGLDHF